MPNSARGGAKNAVFLAALLKCNDFVEECGRRAVAGAKESIA